MAVSKDEVEGSVAQAEVAVELSCTRRGTRCQKEGAWLFRCQCPMMRQMSNAVGWHPGRWCLVEWHPKDWLTEIVVRTAVASVSKAAVALLEPGLLLHPWKVRLEAAVAVVLDFVSEMIVTSGMLWFRTMVHEL